MAQETREYWDRYFRRLSEEGRDLDWGGLWTEPFIEQLRRAGAKRVVDLGCGTGADVDRLVDAGFDVVGVDISETALARAKDRLHGRAEFISADVAQGLPFSDQSFDAAFGNVALHMFPDRVTRTLFDDIRRVVRTRGLFIFHVNAIEDRELRVRRRPGRSRARAELRSRGDGPNRPVLQSRVPARASRRLAPSQSRVRRDRR